MYSTFEPARLQDFEDSHKTRLRRRSEGLKNGGGTAMQYSDGVE